MLFTTYAACFGIELFVHNVAASYYVDHYKLDLQSAGMAAGSFGLLALFARALGGLDRYCASGFSESALDYNLAKIEPYARLRFALANRLGLNILGAGQRPPY